MPFRTRRRAPLWARLAVALGAVLMIASATGIAGGGWLISSATGAITRTNLLGGTAKAAARGDRLTGPVDILLMGVDARKRWAVDDLRADTVIVLHIPAGHDQAYLLSIPRDTEMRIPPYARSGYPGGVAKANEAFFHGARRGGGWAGGAQLLAQTIKLNTGLSFDGAAIIDFTGFKNVIDALHGVRLCVDQRVRSHHMVRVDGRPLYLADARRTGRPQKPIRYDTGCRTMAGWEALDYSRQRYGLTHGDYDRQRHQQQLLKAMARKGAQTGVLTNPVRVNQLIRAAGSAFVLDTGGVPVADFVLGLTGVTANDLILLRTNNGTFAGTGTGRETLTPLSREMFAAVREDRLASFVVNHPAVVAAEK